MNLSLKTIIGLLIGITLVTGVVVGVKLVQTQQQLKSQAAEVMAPAPTGQYPCNRPSQYQVGQPVGRCAAADANGCFQTGYASYTDATQDINGDGVADPNDPGDQPMCETVCAEPKQCPAAPGSAGGGGGGNTPACKCAPNADYGDANNKTAWCACAASCSDAGSLQQGNCPQAKSDDPAIACKLDCNKCPSATTCGNKTYQDCDTSTCKKAGDKFKCQARENANCSYSEYPCDATCIAANTGGGGGQQPPAAGAPAPGAPARPTSNCSYTILDANGADVRQGPIYEKDKYTVQLTFKNPTGETHIWSAPEHKLQATNNTATVWSTQPSYELTKQVKAGDSIVFNNVQITAGALASGKNFEDRTLSFQMADSEGTFGAACEPQIIRVQKKPAGLITTACFVISENATEVDNAKDCTSPAARVYSQHPTSLNFALGNTTAGLKTIYVKFFDAEGNPSNNGVPFAKTIRFSPPPSISGIDCSFLSAGVGTEVKIRGAGFGNQGTGKVRVGSQDAAVSSWADNFIAVKVDQRLEGSSSIKVTTDDGRSAEGTCAVGTTTVVMSIKNVCLKAGEFSADDVEVKIHETSADPLIRQKIKVDNQGNPQGFTPKLEKNKNYQMTVKAPNTLSKRVAFSTIPSTTVLDPVLLMPGDIFPRVAPDGKINNFDTSELKRQWRLTQDLQSSGDLNEDGRVNSIDYSCMIQNLNKEDEVFSPATTAASSPSPSPSASPQPSATGQSCTTPGSCATTLTISANNTAPAVGGSATFQGKLTGFDGHPIAGKVIKIINVDTNTIIGDSTQSNNQGTHNTDLNGEYLILLPINNPTELNVVAKFEGDGSNKPSQSNPVKISPN